MKRSYMAKNVVNHETEKLVSGVVSVVSRVDHQNLRKSFEKAPHLMSLESNYLSQLVIIHVDGSRVSFSQAEVSKAGL